MIRRSSLVLMGIIALGSPVSTASAQSNERVCRAERVKAAEKYLACAQRFMARAIRGLPVTQAVISKCRTRYAAAFPRMQRLIGSSCAQDRWIANGDGTVADNLTGLLWEVKDDLGGLHDKDTLYSWSTPLPDNSDANGTAFTSFLAALNAPPCFAGQCDWRMPSIVELMTILLPEPTPCASSPCIDTARFGPAGPSTGEFCFSHTPGDSDGGVWIIELNQGYVGFGSTSAYPSAVRAVRGGLL